MFEFEQEKKIVVHVGIYFNFEIVISFYFPNQMSKNGPKYKFTFCLFIVFKIFFFISCFQKMK